MIFHNLHTQITAFSTTRNGGVSIGNYASMNCTPYTGDDTEAVQRNLKLLCTALHINKEQLIIPYQTHSVNALVIDKEFLQQNAEKRDEQLQNIDALITQEKGVCLCVSTADCTPILLYDKKQQVIAAIHAGWRGSVNCIVRKTLEQMNRLYNTQGEDIYAAVGPCIGFDAFEVGDEVYDAFKQNDFPMEYISGWKPETHKWHIDLQMANSVQLLDFGVPTEQIDFCDICTFTRHEEFFSARRLGIKSGRTLSGIFMKF